MTMDEVNYQSYLKLAHSIRQMIQDLPAGEILTWHDLHHKDDGDNLPSIMWSLYLESED